MKKRTTINIVAITTSIFLCACSKSDSTTTSTAASAPASAAVAPSSPVINTSSPDNAVKSWWSYIDFKLQEEFELCQKLNETIKLKHIEILPKVAQSETLKARLPKSPACEKEQYSRDIQEVKTESETRAIVFAEVKNSTPIPPGATPDDTDKKWRNNGFKFKYLVEKTSEGWKVSQVYNFDEYKAKYGDKDGWEKLYIYNDTPRYPAYVLNQ